jgi:integrase
MASVVWPPTEVARHLSQWASAHVTCPCSSATVETHIPDANQDSGAYRHGLRVSEAISLRWEQFGLKAGLLSLERLRKGVASTHPLRGPELRALRQLHREWPNGPYLFVSERGGPMTASNVRKLVSRSGSAGKIPFPVHPHALACLRVQARE